MAPATPIPLSPAGVKSGGTSSVERPRVVNLWCTCIRATSVGRRQVRDEVVLGSELTMSQK